ncbi:ribosomal protein L1p/L10e family-domain-containing protein [Blastocladiella britannica]|nr:ribosomal protein L1p/L10e family-domain-containing protein [Blastocladiella britannica]
MSASATPFSHEQALAAITALATYQNGRASKSLLADDGADMYLTVSLKKIPSAKHDKPRFARLTHAPRTLDPRPSVCILTKDLQSDAKIQLRANGVEASKVLGISKLRKKFATYEQRRALAAQFDVFLADAAIVPMLPKLLGKGFFTAKKTPIPVKVATLTPAKLESILHSATYSLPTGTNMTVHLGDLTHLNAAQLTANAVAAVAAISATMPKRCGGFSNIQSLLVRLPGTPALPFYQSLPAIATEQQIAAHTKTQEKARTSRAKQAEKSGSAKDRRQRQYMSMVNELRVDSDDEEAEDEDAMETSDSDK